jgi:RNA-directed DNA polymerase
VSSALDRVRQVAQRDKEARFTALLHHVSLHRLSRAFEEINPKAAPGVDGVSWAEYGQDLGANLRDLHQRVQSGRYRASPSRRACIPKADGRQRPLGIATLEDKIVQRAVVGVLNAVYEADFPGFSYGFRPGRSPHRALDALATGIMQKKVNWVLDADIRDFLDPSSHCSFADFVVQKSPSCGAGISIRRPFLRPVRARTARSSPRLTFCNTVCRETPSAWVA